MAARGRSAASGGTILVVDDLANNRFLLEEALAGLAGEVLTAASGEQALAVVAERQPEVVVVDFQMPGMDGVETSRRIKEHVPFTYILLLSGYHEAEAADGIGRSHADAFLRRPFAIDDVRRAVTEGMSAARARRGSPEA